MRFVFTFLFNLLSISVSAQIDTLQFFNGEYYVLRNDTVIYPVIAEAERATQFPGGTMEMARWIGRDLRIPDAVRRQKVNGRVTVIFRVDKNGILHDFSLKGDTTLGRGDEARRVVTKFPRWIPAMQNRRVVPMRMAVNIDFRVEGAKTKK